MFSIEYKKAPIVISTGLFCIVDHLLCQEYEVAVSQLVRALELLALEDQNEWEDILGANRALARVLNALGREDEATERLERIATIEETICGDERAA